MKFYSNKNGVFFFHENNKLWQDTPHFAILDQTSISKQPATFHLQIVSNLLLQTHKAAALSEP